MSQQQKKANPARKDAVNSELYELGIYVHDYELFISKQIGDILPVIKALPRSSWLNNKPETVSLAS